MNLILIAWLFKGLVAKDSCPAPNATFPLIQIDLNSVLIKNSSRSLIEMPKDFKIVFDIIPRSSSTGFTSILHITGDDQDYTTSASRIPAIYFNPGSTALYIRFGGPSRSCEEDDNQFPGLTSKPLPIGQTTQVTINAIGSVVQVLFNKTAVGLQVLKCDRVYGKAVIYVSDPWYPAADATVKNLFIRATDQFLIPEVSNNWRLSPSTFGIVNVPVDYSISFTITPKSVLNEWGSIFHVSHDGHDLGSKGTRMPAMWFYPGTTQLYVRMDGDTFQDDGITQTAALPVGYPTKVTMTTIAQVFQITFNDTIMAGFWRAPSTRHSGLGYLFMSDPFYSAADATMRNFSIASAVSFTGVDIAAPRTLSPAIFGSIDVPKDYMLTFDLTPTAITDGWGSIVHFSRDQSDLGTLGSRMPGIWFYVSMDGDHFQDEDFSCDRALVIGQTSKIVVEAIGEVVRVSVNGTHTYGSQRAYGPAFLFMADSFYGTADARIAGLAIVPATKFIV